MLIEDLRMNAGVLTEADKLGAGKKGIVVFDIDFTILKPEGIAVLKLDKDGKLVKRLPPEEYDQKETQQIRNEWKSQGGSYSYAEYRDAEKVKNSIIHATPFVKVLRLMDSYIRNGFEVAFLTARGMEEEVNEALKKFLMYRDDNGKLVPIGDKLKRELVNAINDDLKRAKGIYVGNDAEAKKAKLKEYIDSYDIVKFIDDSPMNLKQSEELIPYAQSKGKKFQLINAVKVNKE